MLWAKKKRIQPQQTSCALENQYSSYAAFYMWWPRSKFAKWNDHSLDSNRPLASNSISVWSGAQWADVRPNSKIGLIRTSSTTKCLCSWLNGNWNLEAFIAFSTEKLLIWRWPNLAVIFASCTCKFRHMVFVQLKYSSGLLNTSTIFLTFGPITVSGPRVTEILWFRRQWSSLRYLIRDFALKDLPLLSVLSRFPFRSFLHFFCWRRTSRICQWSCLWTTSLNELLSFLTGGCDHLSLPQASRTYRKTQNRSTNENVFDHAHKFFSPRLAQRNWEPFYSCSRKKYCSDFRLKSRLKNIDPCTIKKYKKFTPRALFFTFRPKSAF